MKSNEERNTSCQQGFGKMGAEVLNSAFVLQSTFVVNSTFVLQMPPLRQAPNR